MIERVFHPIGQGAFYSERHSYDGGQFNIVYDCGNWRNTKLADQVVKQAFTKEDVIDVLFISHFDYDHICKIPTLKKTVKSIDRVILPLLSDKEINLLVNLYRALNYHFIDLIRNPETFFEASTKIIKVKKSNSLSEPSDINQANPINIGNMNSTEIESGSALFFSKMNEWVFIPYNHEYKFRNSELENKLNADGFDVNKLKNDADETLNNVINPKSRKALKTIYNNLSGNINQNSMLVYSGPKSSNDSYDVFVSSFDFRGLRYCYPYYHRFFMDESNRPACVFTGDADLNKTKIKQVFSRFWDAVGTIQIPHHGDLKSFDADVLDDKYYFCPISVGNTNSYGHPSTSLLAQIIGKRSLPILVTEDLTSGFIQIIE